MRDLTPRELSVLTLISGGRSNRQIGAALAISEGTVKGHVHRILRKLRVSNRTEAAVAAVRSGRLHRKLEAPAHRPVDADR
jgi:DNA-binding NarL/FixJ family response regulator